KVHEFHDDHGFRSDFRSSCGIPLFAVRRHEPMVLGSRSESRNPVARAPFKRSGRRNRRHLPGGARSPVCRGSFSSEVMSGKAKDRKSTRLNSSHVKTSYAVFCLKKKNQSLIR